MDLDIVKPQVTMHVPSGTFGSSVTPPAYNERMFDSDITGLDPRCIDAASGAHPSTLADSEQAQEGLARCSFALTRSR